MGGGEDKLESPGVLVQDPGFGVFKTLLLDGALRT